MQMIMKDLYPSGKSRHFRITRERSISIPTIAMQRLGWNYEDEVATQIILNPLTLLMWRAPADRAGYKIHANGRTAGRKEGSGKLSMSGFIKRYIDGHLYNLDEAAPIEILPAYIDYPEPYQVALLLEQPPWSREQLFLPDEIRKIDPAGIGVYRLLSRQGSILKYGKGRIQERLLVQYQEKAKRDIVHQIQFFATQEDIAVAFERIHIALYRAEFGDLPLLNKINA
jgi:hypothetical protein